MSSRLGESVEGSTSGALHWSGGLLKICSPAESRLDVSTTNHKTAAAPSAGPAQAAGAPAISVMLALQAVALPSTVAHQQAVASLLTHLCPAPTWALPPAVQQTAQDLRLQL